MGMVIRNRTILDVDFDSNGKKIKNYIGMPGVKASNVSINWTDEMIAEDNKCSKDILYYAKNYFYHVHPRKGKKLIELYDYQEDILPSLVDERFNIILQSRQSGKCVVYDSNVIIRDKKTLEEKFIKIGKLFDRLVHSNKTRKKFNKDNKFVEAIENNNFEVFTDTGWKSFDGIGKTIPFKKIEIRTKNHTLCCADNHILINSSQKNIFAKDLKVGDFLRTKKGLDEVVEIIYHETKKPMYDLLNVENQKYYTNGLLSHNSTVVSLFCSWYVLYNDDKTILIVSKDKDSAKDVLDKIKVAFQNLPYAIQPGVVEWNKTTIEFDNGCKIIVTTNPRGKTGNILLLDEAAHIKGWRDFSQNALPTITVDPESKVIMVGTPNGRNHFHNYWYRANKPKDDKEYNNFIPWLVTWDMVPGRDASWKEQTLKLLSDEVGSAGAMEKFEREYNCKFDSTTGALLRADTLNWFSDISMLPLNVDVLYSSELKKLADYKKYLRMYRLKELKHRYVMGIDSSTNIQDGTGDSTALTIYDVTSIPFKQCCIINISEGISYREIPYIAYAVGTYYNNAYIFTENNEGAGREANRVLEDMGYENLYWDNTTLAGFRTTQKSKKLGCENFKLIADNKNIEIYDISLISQLGHFVKKKTSYAGDGDEPDDEVMSTIAALYFLTLQDDIMLQNILGDTNILNNHHVLFQKILNKNCIETEKSILTTQDILEIMTRDDSEAVQERIMKNMNIKDEDKIPYEFDIFKLMADEIKERENGGAIDRDGDFIPF